MRQRATSTPARGADHDGQRLTRALVVGRAIALADAEGLPAVTIRRVAADLGTRPMTLYTHIGSKDELLDLMRDAAVDEVIVREPLPAQWRQAVRVIAHRAHGAFVAHPWLAALSASRTSLGPNALRHAEQMLTAIAPLGLDSADAWEALYLVNDYTLGHATRIAHEPRGQRGHFPAFDPAAYPHLAQALSAAPRGRGADTFAAGLDTVLDGIARRFAASDPPTDARGRLSGTMPRHAH